jgi:eukaryotic-like serine/threonine-protein kinase
VIETQTAQREPEETPATTGTVQRVWRFAEAVLDERSLELRVRGQPVEVERKPLQVMLCLLRHAGEVVTKDEIVEAVWPGRIVTDSSLTRCVTLVRQALGDGDQNIIRTVHGYGYRLVAPVAVDTPAAALPPPRFDFRPGDHPPMRPLWDLSARLGAGGHGEVWLAHHSRTREPRVYKFALDGSALASLKREITLSRLLRETLPERDDFVRVLDWNLDQPPCYIECEHTAGGSLLAWAEAGGGLAAIPLAARLEVLAKVADALGAAHSVGVLHKDLKPANVLVVADADPPRVRLGDFGSGAVIDPERLEALGITRLGFTRSVAAEATTSGTVLYFAPEVLAGQPFTVRSDVYALGVMLYQLATGDFRKSLAPGWENDIEDELLREDIAAAGVGDPRLRLADAALLAQNLRSIESRRARRREQNAARVEVEKQRKALERYRVRRWWTAGVAATLGLGLTLGGLVWWDTWMAYAHPLGALGLLGDVAVEAERRGDLTEAEQILRRSLAIQAQRNFPDPFGGEAEASVWTHGQLGRVLAKQHRNAEAEAEYAIALSEAAESFGPDDYRYAAVMAAYSRALAASGRETEARDLLEQAHAALMRAMERAKDPDTRRRIAEQLAFDHSAKIDGSTTTPTVQSAPKYARTDRGKN